MSSTMPLIGGLCSGDLIMSSRAIAVITGAASGLGAELAKR